MLNLALSYSARLKDALSLLERFQPSDNPSQLETITLVRKSLMKARILRFLGSFEQARDILDSITHPDNEVSIPTLCNAMHHLAAVNCELNNSKKGGAIIKHYLELFHERKWQNLARTRLLQLSLAECLLEDGEYAEAQEVYEPLLETYETLPQATYLMRMAHVRVYLGLARISHIQGRWQHAISLWQKVRNMAVEFCDRGGFTEMVAVLSLSDAYLKTGQYGCEDLYRQGEDMYKRNGIQHWYAGIGSKWVPIVRTELQREIGRQRVGWHGPAHARVILN
jgi:tetratricopeptide (TPR) repeat protein